jgi:hypothetical protein
VLVGPGLLFFVVGVPAFHALIRHGPHRKQN